MNSETEDLKCDGCKGSLFNIDTYIGYNQVEVLFGSSTGEIVHECSCVFCGRKYTFKEI